MFFLLHSWSKTRTVCVLFRSRDGCEILLWVCLFVYLSARRWTDVVLMYHAVPKIAHLVHAWYSRVDSKAATFYSILHTSICSHYRFSEFCTVAYMHCYIVQIRKKCMRTDRGLHQNHDPLFFPYKTVRSCIWLQCRTLHARRIKIHKPINQYLWRLHNAIASTRRRPLLTAAWARNQRTWWELPPFCRDRVSLNIWIDCR